jgi:hydrogenase/urease accessory protein HupE
MSFALAVAVLPSLASAHAVGLSQGRYEPSGRGLDAELTFTRSELAGAAGTTAPERWIAERIEVEGCTLGRTAASPAERDGVTVRAAWACEHAPKQVRLDFLSELPPGHRHLAEHHVLHAGEPVLVLGAPQTSFAGVVRLGVEHILTGWDHLLFLFGMVLVAARARAVLKVVTAFTVAHSVTLALSALGVLAPSPRWVEPLIALSIAYVGVENLLTRDLEKRWRVAFGFGLLHGFGFAGGLLDVGAARSELPLVLFGFNLGVELGQLAVLAALLPALAWLRRSPGAWRFARPALSAGVVVPALAAFVARL